MIIFVIINIVLSVVIVAIATAIFIIQKKEIKMLTIDKANLKKSNDYHIEQLRKRSEADDK